MTDMCQKGRHVKGVAVPNAKLSPKKVVGMRRLYATGAYSTERLAKIYQVSQSTAWRTINQTWKHVT